MKRDLFRTERRASSDFAVHAKMCSKPPKRVKDCTTPILADKQSVSQEKLSSEDVTPFRGLRGDGSDIQMDAILVRAE
jgi:hypothetical protein